MKLKQWFKLSENDAETVKVGVEDGSSFMYCGKVTSPARILDRMFFNVIDLINEYQKHTTECEPSEKWDNYKIMEVRKKINSMILELARFNDALNREVVNEYPSSDIRNQVIVEIESKCAWNCAYWDIEEFDKRWKYGQFSEPDEDEDESEREEVIKDGK